jgi:hypothetical protein
MSRISTLAVPVPRELINDRSSYSLLPAIYRAEHAATSTILFTKMLLIFYSSLCLWKH